MREYCTRYKSLYVRETLGFALFLAWVYCSLFGCGLASYENSPVGVTTVYNLEHIWMVSGLFEALGGASSASQPPASSGYPIARCKGASWARSRLRAPSWAITSP